jgi:hypothetical protein
MRAPFKISAALLALLLCAGSGLAQAAETLHPRLFWRAPPGPTPEQSLVITAGAAYPDGGLAVAGYREGDPERYIYRIDPAGRTMWELKIETGEGAISVLVRDPLGGLVFCGGNSSVRRVDAEGRLDWIAANYGSTGRSLGNGSQTCDALVALPDGSVIVAVVLLTPERGDDLLVRLSRIGPSGNPIWSRDWTAPWWEGSIRKMLPLPDGDVEIVYDPDLPLTNAHPPFLDRPIIWQWRISPEGELREPNRMQQEMPLRGDWYGVQAIYLLRDGLVRVGAPTVGEPTNEHDCRLAFEAWSLDGNRLLARGFFPPSGECDARGDDTGDRSRSLLFPPDFAPELLAGIDARRPIVQYQVPPPMAIANEYSFARPWETAELPHGAKVFLFGSPSDIYVADLPASR